MESQQQESYRPLKTVKTFMSNVQACFQKREGDKLSNELKQLYYTKSFINIPEKNWNVSVNTQAFAQYDTIGQSFAKVIQLIRDFSQSRAGKRWSDAFEKHMQTLISIVKVLEQMKEYREWLAKPLRVVLRATKRIFLEAQKNVTNSSAAAKLKNNLLNTLQRFKSARAIIQQIKKEFLPLIDIMQISILLSFHNYEQIQKIIYSPKIYGDFGPRYIDNFLFQKGKYALVNQNLKEAEECFERINVRTQGQRRLILRYLIPCKMLLGKLLTSSSPSNVDFSEYGKIQKTILQSNFKVYEQLNQKYQKVWLKRGIYLLMDRMRILLWRQIIKKLLVLVGNKIELELIEKAVRVKGGKEDINECICIVGNLIYEGYIKGYIFQNQTKRTLVLKAKDSFPSLYSIAK